VYNTQTPARGARGGAGAADGHAGQTLDLFEERARLARHASMAIVTPINLQSWAADLRGAGSALMYAAFRQRPFATLMVPSYRRARLRMQEVIDEAITRHRRGDFASASKTHMIDACLRATNADGDRMDQRSIRGACFYALAGTEIYIGRLIGFMIFELLKNRAFLDRVVAEIDEVSASADPTLAFRRMPYLRAAYFETLRCYPLIPSYPYKADEDLVIGGFVIPRGQLILFAPYVAHFCHEQYANPMAFDPERHLAPRRESSGARLFSAFGVGSHACSAQGLVETITLTIVSALLRRVALELARPSYSMRLRMTPLIAPKHAIELRVRGRRSTCSPDVASVLLEAPDFDGPTDWRHAVDRLPPKQPEVIAAGEVLIEAGAPASSFFVLLAGRVTVAGAGSDGSVTQLRELGPGDSFGELGLLKGCARAPTVTVKEPVTVLRFSRLEFESIVAEFDLTAEDMAIMAARFTRGGDEPSRLAQARASRG
jgi:cytochrome P450